uniref:Uncharacterized protein n=1 Tax=Arundo donax TaxID=35708 RepID=A0A0A9FLD4_ARUDO
MLLLELSLEVKHMFCVIGGKYTLLAYGLTAVQFYF